MKIKKVSVGNATEAYIEDRFSNNLNIISSDDNNKGKTIVIQSMMYALGNEPIFPSSFDFRNYYYIVEIELDNQELITVARKQNSFTVHVRGSIAVFDSVTEFKHFLSKNVFKLPLIIKDASKKLVDPVLFYEIFFVGQDNKNTSNILHTGYYNKNDFINMIYSYAGIDNIESIQEISERELTAKIKKINTEIKELEKQNKILKSALPAIGIASAYNDKMQFEEKLDKVEKIKNIIIGLSSRRNNATSRRIKNEITLKELRSLNQTLTAGKLHCLDCNSTNVGYASADNAYIFDISSTDIRKQILESIEEKVSIYSEEIESITLEINKYQKELQSILTVDEVSIQSLLMYKVDLVNASVADSKILDLTKQLRTLDLKRHAEVDKEIINQNKRKELLVNILDEMNKFYKIIEPKGNLHFDELFARKQSVYSGVEETEFYLSKLYALKKVLNHDFPIIIDYFRDGELSSAKEAKVIELFNGFSNQVIFTATLKDQEIGKYDSLQDVNHINYIKNTPFKLLSARHVDDFFETCRMLSLKVTN